MVSPAAGGVDQPLRHAAGNPSMTISLTLTLERLEDGLYRVGFNPPDLADENRPSDPSMYETGTLEVALSDLGDRLASFFQACRERAIPRTEDDAEIGPVPGGVPADVVLRTPLS
jgi:hypothetical protein